MRDPRQQGDFACLVPIRAGQHQALEALLHPMGDEVANPHPVDFNAMTTVHFLRWVIVPPLESGGVYQLALSTNYDPPRARHLRQLIAVAGSVFHDIYGHCDGYPGADATPERIIAYLTKHRVKSSAFYVGHACRTRDQILAEAGLRDRLQAACDAVDRDGGAWVGRGARAVRDRLRRELDRHPFVASLPSRMSPARIRFWLSLLFWGLLGLVALVPFLIPLLVKERLEARDNEANKKKWFAAAHDPAHINSLVDREDYVVQNQITHLVPIKRGLTRWVSLRITLGLINGLARYYFNKGHLNHIPTIHFARWCIIDGGKRLLFFSNYDSSWESYLGDFIDQASKGLTAVWSNTEGYPEAVALAFRGARDEEHFKNWTRAHQIPTQLWFSAYPNLSVRNVNHNTELRRGLVAAPRNDEELEAWTRLL